NGPSCDDEINLVLPGFNYGWDVDYPCYGLDLIPGMADYMPPLLSFTPTVGISGIIFYDHDAIPEWENDLFFCNWTFGELYRAELDETRSQVDAVHLVDLGDASCKIDITVGPEGGLYFGSVGEGNGYIYRLLPADS
ncbi:MAG: PQQ-dependent sugar dehydrogenase, partial [Chloroflexota bacterium]